MGWLSKLLSWIFPLHESSVTEEDRPMTHAEGWMALYSACCYLSDRGRATDRPDGLWPLSVFEQAMQDVEDAMRAERLL